MLSILWLKILHEHWSGEEIQQEAQARDARATWDQQSYPFCKNVRAKNVRTASFTGAATNSRQKESRWLPDFSLILGQLFLLVLPRAHR